MEILRKISHGLVTGLLGLVLALGIILVALSLVLTNRDTVKSWPVDAGIYPKITRQLLDTAEEPQEESQTETNFDILEGGPLDHGDLKRILESVFTAGYWQTQLEAAIDSAYDWLEGTVAELEFEINLSNQSDELDAAIEAELTRQLADYPTCPLTPDLRNYDPLAADCLPPGVSAEQAASLISDEINSEAFLEGAALDSDDVDFDEEFRKNAPTAYSIMDSLPLIFAATAAILAILAVFSAKSRLRGVRKTGQLLFGIGLVSWLGFFIGNRVGAGFELASNTNNTDEQLFADLGQPLAKVAFDDFTTTGLWVALAVVLTGMLMWLGAFIWHKVHHDETEANRQTQKPKRDPKLPKPVRPEDKN